MLADNLVRRIARKGKEMSGRNGWVRKSAQVSLGGPGERQFGLCGRADLHMREEMGKHEISCSHRFRRLQLCQHQSFVVSSQISLAANVHIPTVPLPPPNYCSEKYRW